MQREVSHCNSGFRLYFPLLPQLKPNPHLSSTTHLELSPQTSPHPPQKNVRVSFAKALQMCTSINARLCSSEELSEGVAAGTGCDVESKRVWSSTQCQNGVVTRLGRGSASKGDVDAMCVPAKHRYNVVCCADDFRSGPRSKRHTTISYGFCARVILATRKRMSQGALLLGI